MENSNPRKPVRNGETWTLPGNFLSQSARKRGDVVIEMCPYSPGSVSTIVIHASDAEQIHSGPVPLIGAGWTSVVIEFRPDHWMNLVVHDVDVLIEALQRAKRQ